MICSFQGRIQSGGRIELYSDEIARFAYDDCPLHPAWIEPAEWLGGGQTTAMPLAAH
jgi:anaerobic selenocysteine-containing dehydrogenase